MILDRVDNFLNDSDIKEISEICQSGWAFQKSDFEDNTLAFLYRELDDNFVTNKLKPLLKEKITSLFPNFKIERAYLNGQWNGRDGNFHKDDGDITILIYLNEEYNLEWGGFTQFIDEDKKISLVETPVFNRAIIFRGETLHKSYAFCYQNCPMRVTLAIKLKIL